MSEPIEFLSPRLVGERFENHAIPLELLKDLAVIEELVVEIAKWLYLQDHTERRRVPRGFTAGITLKLTGVAEGSAIPQIGLFTDTTTLFPLQGQRYLENARERMINAIANAEQERSVTEHLPEHILGYFDRIGRSLQDNEAIEFNPKNPARRARLDKVTRRRLLLGSSSIQNWTEEVRLRGCVPEADQERMTFQLQVINGPKVSAPIDTQHLATVLEAMAGYFHGTRVLLEGIGRYNRLGRLQSIDAVEHISILDTNDVGARIEELRALKNGWLDGLGLAPSAEGLTWFSKSFELQYPEDLPLPFIYPTAEGGVQAEWSLSAHEISLEIDLDSQTGEWHDHDSATDRADTQTLNLAKPEEWARLAAKIADYSGGIQ